MLHLLSCCRLPAYSLDLKHCKKVFRYSVFCFCTMNEIPFHFMHSLIYSSIHFFIHPFILSSIRSFIFLFILSFFHSFILLFIWMLARRTLHLNYKIFGILMLYTSFLLLLLLLFFHFSFYFILL